MALIKHEYSGWKIDMGDNLEPGFEEQLKLSDEELGRAINMEHVTDRLFARILKNRSKAHQALLEKVPGVSGD